MSFFYFMDFFFETLFLITGSLSFVVCFKDGHIYPVKFDNGVNFFSGFNPIAFPRSSTASKISAEAFIGFYSQNNFFGYYTYLVLFI